MKRYWWMTGLVGMVLLGMLASGSSAAEMKTVVIENFPNDPVKVSEAARVIKALEDAGFIEGQNVMIQILYDTDIEADAAKIQEIQPDVIIDISQGHRIAYKFRGASLPLLIDAEAEKFTDAQGVPLENVSGMRSRLKDMLYNSYKFLAKVAPLKPGQQVVFLENTAFNLIPQEEVKDALRRLNIPLKAVVDTSVYEDWQAAIEQYTTDPDVGWVLMGVWPSSKRDGSLPDMERESAPWQRTHLKKPMVTYWEIAVQWRVLCGFGVDIDELGTQLGEMAARVLNGEDITTIKAEYPRKTAVALNRKTAESIGIIFSPDVLNLANVIFHDWDGKEVTRKSGLK